jgi:hypothetical protein
MIISHEEKKEEETRTERNGLVRNRSDKNTRCII